MAMVARVLDALKDVDARDYEKAPPLHRLCWRLGIMVPPPSLASFWVNAVLLGIFFGVAYGLVITVVFPAIGIPSRHSLTWMAIAALSAGVLFGLGMALYFRHKASRHDLPSWQSLVEAERGGH